MSFNSSMQSTSAPFPPRTDTVGIWARIGWSGFRLAYIACAGIGLFTAGLGFYLIAPLISHCFFNDWRFWRYLRFFPRIIAHVYRIFYLMLKDRYAFIFSVPLDSPPQSRPDPSKVEITHDWPHGESSCGTCYNCCLSCPFVDRTNHRCLSYNSPFWKYFNCGRFPISPKQIEYYRCTKWRFLN